MGRQGMMAAHRFPWRSNSIRSRRRGEIQFRDGFMCNQADDGGTGGGPCFRPYRESDACLSPGISRKSSRRSGIPVSPRHSPAISAPCGGTAHESLDPSCRRKPRPRNEVAMRRRRRRGIVAPGPCEADHVRRDPDVAPVSPPCFSRRFHNRDGPRLPRGNAGTSGANASSAPGRSTPPPPRRGHLRLARPSRGLRAESPPAAGSRSRDPPPDPLRQRQGTSRA